MKKRIAGRLKEWLPVVAIVAACILILVLPPTAGRRNAPLSVARSKV